MGRMGPQGREAHEEVKGKRAVMRSCLTRTKEMTGRNGNSLVTCGKGRHER